MKKAFTLLELVVVIIILGILGTLGTQQYFRMIERSRGAEAKMIMGQIRTTAAGYYMDTNDLTNFDNDEAGIGSEDKMIPDSCGGTHYFYYNVTNTGTNGLTIMAERCNTESGGGGKSPDAPSAANLTLEVDFSSTGSGDSWTSNPKGVY